MPDFYRTAQLSDQEQATLADAINGTNIEHLLAALRQTFNKHTRTTLATLAKTGTMTADTASAASDELAERIELLSHLPTYPKQPSCSTHTGKPTTSSARPPPNSASSNDSRDRIRHY